MSNAPIPPAPHPLSWRTVLLGTKFLSAGTLTLMIGLVLAPMSVALQFYLLGERYAAQEMRGRGIPDAIVLAALFVVALGWLLWLTGLCLCALAPAEAGARPFALLAALCCIFALLAGLQTSLLPVVGFAPIRPRVMLDQRDRVPAVTALNEIGFGASAGALLVAGAVLSTCALAALAAHFHNIRLVDRVHRLLVGHIAAAAALVALGFGYLCTAAVWRNAGLWLDAPFLGAAWLVVGLAGLALLHTLSALRTVFAIADENARAFETSPQ